MTKTVLDMKADVEALDTGIDGRSELAGQLADCLADTMMLMIKTQGYHWNVVGPMFHALHEMTEEQYRDLFTAADDLAERVRALGHPAPTGVGELQRLSAVDDETEVPTAERMLERLIADHERIARRFREVAENAEAARDIATADLLTARITTHEKTVWMLKAMANG